MRKKSKKEEVVEEQPIAAPEPPPEEIQPAPPQEPPEPLPEPEEVPAQEALAPPIAVQPAEEELPPPPGDIAEQMKDFKPFVTRKPGLGAALKRAGVIFGKDIGTMAKHGLVSSVILLVFLLIVFYISSYAMFRLVTTSMEEGGGDGPNLTNDGSLVADAGNNMTIMAGGMVTLDSSVTIHRANLMYVEWRISAFNGQLPDDVSLYGPQVSYKFGAIGEYTVDLSVVDADWNYDEDNITITVNRDGTDDQPPMPLIEAYPSPDITYGSPITFNATNSTDNVAIVDYTWIIGDAIDSVRHGPVVNYVFNRTGDHQVVLITRDSAGNFARMEGHSMVFPSTDDSMWPQARMGDLPQSVKVGDTVELDASGSSDDRGIADYSWYIKLNNTMIKRSGQKVSFTAQGFGMYEIVLVVRDQAGNAGTDERGVLSLAVGMRTPSSATWTSTPLGQDVPFNVLIFTYGAALLACVIYVGGLFSKGFAYEIQKGTAKTLFFAPISVTNMIFAKMLYPLAIGPAFIFPLMLVSTLPLEQSAMDVFTITLVSYVMTALVMASAAYGSCLIYAATKRMSIKPTALARIFMYLSLVATLTIFVGLAFLMDQWFTTDMWSGMYENLGSKIAMFSPFHQGGILLSNILLGTAESPDWIVFVIPAALIVGGAVVSRKLFPDLFSRE